MTSPQPPEAPQPPGEASVVPEAAFALLVLAALKLWLDAVAAAVLAPWRLFGLTPDPSALWSTVPLWNRQLDKLIDQLGDIARMGWEAAQRQLGTNVPFDVTNPMVQDQLNRTRNLLVRIPDEVYRQILTALNSTAGRSRQEQAAAVQRVFDVTGSEFWPNRARTVAATETHRAWNFGALAAGLHADAIDARQLWKRWDAREDTRTRPAHAAADGQQVPVHQPFIVDNQPLMAPNDPSGAPENVINCRCKPRLYWKGQ